MPAATKARKAKPAANQWTMLFKAAPGKDLMKWLGANPAFDLASRDEQGRIPLMLAAYRGLDQVVSAIIDRAPDTIDLVDSKGRKAILYAFTSGNTDTAVALVKASEPDHRLSEKLFAINPKLMQAVAYKVGERQVTKTKSAAQLLDDGLRHFLNQGSVAMTLDIAQYRAHLDQTTEPRMAYLAVFKSWLNGDNTVTETEVVSILKSLNSRIENRKAAFTPDGDSPEINYLIGTIDPDKMLRTRIFTKLSRLARLSRHLDIYPAINIGQNENIESRQEYLNALNFSYEATKILGPKHPYPNADRLLGGALIFGRVEEKKQLQETLSTMYAKHARESDSPFWRAMTSVAHFAENGGPEIPQLLSSEIHQAYLRKSVPDIPLTVLAFGAALGGWLPKFIKNEGLKSQTLNAILKDYKGTLYGNYSTQQLVIPNLIYFAVRAQGKNDKIAMKLIKSVASVKPDPIQTFVKFARLFHSKLTKKCFLLLKELDWTIEDFRSRADDIFLAAEKTEDVPYRLMTTFLAAGIVPSDKTMRMIFDRKPGLEGQMHREYAQAVALREARLLAEEMKDLRQSPRTRKSVAVL